MLTCKYAGQGINHAGIGVDEIIKITLCCCVVYFNKINDLMMSAYGEVWKEVHGEVWKEVHGEVWKEAERRNWCCETISNKAM